MRNRSFEFRLPVVCWLLAARQPGTPISTGAATPTGALPPGTRLSDVHVVKLTPNNQAASPTADLPFAYSRLEPDGPTWAQLITFTLGVTGQVNSLPLRGLISLNGRQP